MEIDPVVRGAGYALTGTGVTALIISLFRKLIKDTSSTSVSMAQDSTQKETLTQLREEIARLEKLVKGMQDRIEVLEQRQSRCNQVFVEAQMAMVDVERSLLKCECSLVDGIRLKLDAVMDILVAAAKEMGDNVRSSKCG